jgi:hypothetical protein
MTPPWGFQEFRKAKLRKTKNPQGFLVRARGTKTRSVLVFGVWGKPQTPPKGFREFRKAKLRKIKTAKRF